MARRGWVSAEVAEDTWRRLVAFDDGWVELTDLGRAVSDTRRNLRDSWVVLVVVTAALALASALDVLGAPPYVVVPCALVALGALAYAVARGFRARSAGGAGSWQQATSAAELAGGVDGEVLVSASEVVAVETDEQRVSHLRYRVQVRLRDGSTRTYASPDKTLPRLLAAYGPGGNNPAGT